MGPAPVPPLVVFKSCPECRSVVLEKDYWYHEQWHAVLNTKLEKLEKALGTQMKIWESIPSEA
jgi:uncharacterized protein with PIN domain